MTGTENAIMAAVLARGTTSIYNAACEPHVQDLCHLLNAMGAGIQGIGSNMLTIHGVQALRGCRHRVGPITSRWRRSSGWCAIPSLDAPSLSHRAQDVKRLPLCRAILCIWRTYLFALAPADAAAVAVVYLRGHSSGVYVGKVLQFFPLFAAYPLIRLATAQHFRLPSLRKFGDVSYGMYLYGWPIEQISRAVLGEATSWWAIFAIALPVSAALGFVSWHLLEKRALQFKKWRPVVMVASNHRGGRHSTANRAG